MSPATHSSAPRYGVAVLAAALALLLTLQYPPHPRYIITEPWVGYPNE